MPSLSTEAYEKTFSRTALGYNIKEVEAFLNYVIDEASKLEKQNYQLAMQVRDYERRLSYPAGQEAVPVPMPKPVVQPAQQPVSQPVQSIPKPASQPASADAPGMTPVAAQPAGTREFKPAEFKPATFTPAPIPVPAAVEAQPVKAAEKTDDGSANATALLARAQKMYDEMLADAKKDADKLIREAKEQVEAQTEKMLRDKQEVEEEIEMLKASARDYKRRFTQLIEDQEHLLNSEKVLFD